MLLIAIGLLLWTFPHLLKQIAPGLRARLGDGAARPLVAVVTLISVLLMVIGFRGADYIAVYDPPAWGRHLNNLLMVVAIVLLAAAHSRSRLKRHLRHPMLMGSMLWGVAHLLVNGDAASLLLFGGIAIWSLFAMTITNQRAHDYVPYAGGSTAGDIRLAAISAVLFAVIVAIHTWLGYWPFPG